MPSSADPYVPPFEVVEVPPNAALAPSIESPKRIDLGCGPNKAEGFFGVDRISFPGVDLVVDIGNKPWPFSDNSVEEARAMHFVEHLDALERIHFVNELYRVLAPGAKALIVVPHWASGRAYGDPTHKWPPVAEFWFYYLDRTWRLQNAPHTDASFALERGYSCDFPLPNNTYGYSLHQAVAVKSQVAQQEMLTWYKEAAQDTIATFTKPAVSPAGSK